MVLSFQTLQHKGMIPWWLSCNLITFHQPPSRSKEDSSKTVIIPPACWYNLVGRFNSMQVSIKMWIPLYKNHGVLKKRSIWYFSIIFACPKPQDPNHLPGVKCHLSPAPQNKSWNGSPPNLRFWSFPVFSSFQGPSCLNSPTARAVPGCTFSNGTLKECKGPLWKPWKPMKNLERKLYKLMGGQQSTPWHLLTWELQNADQSNSDFVWNKPRLSQPVPLFIGIKRTNKNLSKNLGVTKVVNFQGTFCPNATASKPGTSWHPWMWKRSWRKLEGWAAQNLGRLGVMAFFQRNWFELRGLAIFGWIFGILQESPKKKIFRSCTMSTLTR